MEPAMKVADLLRIKGSVVKTVPPHETALILSGQMRAEQIGALVVSRDGKSIEGIVSELLPMALRHTDAGCQRSQFPN